MKKFFLLTLAFVATCVMSMQAQEVKELYNQGHKLEKEFKKGLPTPEKQNIKPTAEQAEALVQALDIYEKVMQLDTLPNEKGEVKPKYTEKIMKSLVEYAAKRNLNDAAVALFNAGKKYPEAHEMFMLSGTLSAMQGLPVEFYNLDFVNAGHAAFGNDFAAAHEAYAAARASEVNDPEIYKYDIAALQNIAVKDTTEAQTIAKQCQAEIKAVAKEGYDRFGATDDYVFNTYMQHFIDDNDYDGAIVVLDKAIAADPTHDNLYRLRGLVDFSKKDYKQAVEDFRKMAEVSNNFAYLREAAGYVNDCGKRYLGTLDTVSPEQKAEILGMYQAAMQIVDKAKAAPDASSMDDVVEDIEYNVENANKLAGGN